jgi:hypothetical protein
MPDILSHQLRVAMIPQNYVDADEAATKEKIISI